jgi:hypothetical protein
MQRSEARRSAHAWCPEDSEFMAFCTAACAATAALVFAVVGFNAVGVLARAAAYQLLPNLVDQCE